MRTAGSQALIAARISDLDTQTGQLRGLVPGYILCERSEQRMAMRPTSSKFIVRPWESDHIRLVAKGLNPLVSGDAGADLDGRPLFLAAAQRYPERKEEFLAVVEQIDANRKAKLLEDARQAPTAAQQAENQAAIIAEGVARGMAQGMSGLADTVEAPTPHGEPAPKRGDAEPRPTKARE